MDREEDEKERERNDESRGDVKTNLHILLLQSRQQILQAQVLRRKTPDGSCESSVVRFELAEKKRGILK